MSTYIKLLTFRKVRELVNSKITNTLVQDVDSDRGFVVGVCVLGGGDIWELCTSHSILL